MLKLTTIAALFFIWAPCIKAQKITYLSLSDSTLYKISPFTCDTTYVGKLPAVMHDIALTTDGKLYGTDRFNLYEINRSTGLASNLGSLLTSITGYFNSLEANDKNLIGYNVNGGLYSIKSDLTVNLIGHTSFIPKGDLVRLHKAYFASVIPSMNASTELVRIDFNPTYTGIVAVTPVGSLSGISSVYGLSETDGFIFGYSENNSYSIDPLSGSHSIYCAALIDSSVQIMGAASGECGMGGLLMAEPGTIEQVTEEPCHSGRIKFPNVFTPNGDGLNDEFRSNSSLREIQIQIFNRWGNLVQTISTTGSNGWDGTDKEGRPCVPGTYIYSAYFTNVCGESDALTGHVELVR